MLEHLLSLLTLLAAKRNLTLEELLLNVLAQEALGATPASPGSTTALLAPPALPGPPGALLVASQPLPQPTQIYLSPQPYKAPIDPETGRPKIGRPPVVKPPADTNAPKPRRGRPPKPRPPEATPAPEQPKRGPGRPPFARPPVAPDAPTPYKAPLDPVTGKPKMGRPPKERPPTPATPPVPAYTTLTPTCLNDLFPEAIGHGEVYDLLNMSELPTTNGPWYLPHAGYTNRESLHDYRQEHLPVGFLCHVFPLTDLTTDPSAEERVLAWRNRAVPGEDAGQDGPIYVPTDFYESLFSPARDELELNQRRRLLGPLPDNYESRLRPESSRGTGGRTKHLPECHMQISGQESQGELSSLYRQKKGPTAKGWSQKLVDTLANNQNGHLITDANGHQAIDSNFLGRLMRGDESLDLNMLGEHDDD